MADRFVLSHVRRLPIFARLTPEQSEWVAEVTQILRYEVGEVVYQQGQPPPGMFMFISGGGTLSQRGADGVERPFGKVGENEYINESALFNTAASPMTLRTGESSIVLFLARQQMQTVLAYHPEVRQNMVLPASIQTAVAAAPKPPVTTAATGTSLRDNETVLLQVHRHWWAFVGHSLWVIILLIALGFGFVYVSQQSPQFPWLFIVLPVTFVLGLMIVYFYLEWQNDVFVITDRRVINTHQTILTFKKEVNEIPLDGIHEIAISLPALTDLPGRLLGYGSVIIKTSGDSNTMVMTQIPHPKEIQQTIFANRKRYQEMVLEQKQNSNRNAIKAEIDKFVANSTGGPNTTNTSNKPTTITSSPGLFSLKYTNEKGETVYRKHHSIWLQHVFLGFVMIIAGIIVLLVGAAGILLPLGIMALGAVMVYIGDWDWRNDMYIVGDQTITIIRKRPLFLQDQKDQVSLADVDNVVAQVSGFFDTLLQIGDVKLVLVGTDERNAKVFTGVYQPQQIQQEISKRQDRAEQAKRDQDAQRQRQAIVEYLSVYHESLGQGEGQGQDGSAQNTPPPVYNPPPFRGTNNNANGVPPNNNMSPLGRNRPPGIPRTPPPRQ